MSDWLTLVCRCKAEEIQGRWFIAAEAFLCREGHKQGDPLRGSVTVQPSPRDEGKPAEGKAS